MTAKAHTSIICDVITDYFTVGSVGSAASPTAAFVVVVVFAAFCLFCCCFVFVFLSGFRSFWVFFDDDEFVTVYQDDFLPAARSIFAVWEKSIVAALVL